MAYKKKIACRREQTENHEKSTRVSIFLSRFFLLLLVLFIRVHVLPHIYEIYELPIWYPALDYMTTTCTLCR